MILNFVGLFNQSPGTGEISDETPRARSIEELGHTVRRIPRDEWREYVIENLPSGKYPNIPDDLTCDFNLFAKWHQFFDGSFIRQLKGMTGGAPTFLWVWDYMQDGVIPAWHLSQVQASDLYLGNDVRNPAYMGMKNCYYFPFDVADENLDTWLNLKPDYINQVAFFGSCIDQGDRKEWLQTIDKVFPVKIYASNYKDWQKLGLYASPAVYGNVFNKLVSQTKINLGFSVYPSCWGYWSNRTGKTLLAGGFLLQQYAPGMEQVFGNCIKYFSSPEEAIEKIKYYLEHDQEREAVRGKGHILGRKKFSSKQRVKELMILAERYLKDNRKELWQL